MAGIFENSWRGAAAEADAIGEQQLKRTQSGSSRRSGRHRGAELKRTQLGSSSRSGRNREAVDNRDQHAQLKADASGEKQLKQMQAGSSAAVEAMQSREEQQLKRTQSGSSSSAQRAIRHRITHLGERGGSS